MDNICVCFLQVVTFCNDATKRNMEKIWSSRPEPEEQARSILSHIHMLQVFVRRITAQHTHILHTHPTHTLIHTPIPIPAYSMQRELSQTTGKLQKTSANVSFCLFFSDMRNKIEEMKHDVKTADEKAKDKISCGANLKPETLKC